MTSGWTDNGIAGSLIPDAQRDRPSILEGAGA